MRDALSYVPKAQQSMVSAALRQAFIQSDRPSASQMLRHVADQLRAKWPKLGALFDESEADVLSHIDFPAQHRTKIHSTNPLPAAQADADAAYAWVLQNAASLGGNPKQVALAGESAGGNLAIDTAIWARDQPPRITRCGRRGGKSLSGNHPWAQSATRRS